MDMKHVKYLALVLCIGNLSPVMAQTASKSLTVDNLVEMCIRDSPTGGSVPFPLFRTDYSGHVTRTDLADILLFVFFLPVSPDSLFGSGN